VGGGRCSKVPRKLILSWKVRSGNSRPNVKEKEIDGKVSRAENLRFDNRGLSLGDTQLERK
jgi:hypothetical protein